MSEYKNDSVGISEEYEVVKARIKAFNSDHNETQILTEIVTNNEETGEVIFKAHTIVDSVILATGHAMASRDSNKTNKTSHIERAETNAIGRALAMMGYFPK